MNKSEDKASAPKSHVMLAYHGDAAFRRRFLAEIRKHEKNDAIMRGTYGSLDGKGNWRGCAVGCSLRSLNRLADKPRGKTSEHSRYPKELGIPVELAHLEDRLFEGMPADLASGWPMRFSSAIRTSADLSLVWDRFSVWLLVDEKDGVIRFANNHRTRDAIRGVAALFERRIAGETVTRAEWSEARSSSSSSASAAAAAAAAADADAASASAYAYAYASAAAAAADADAAYASAYAYAYASAAAAAAADADAYAAYAYASASAAAAAAADADAYASAARSLAFARQAEKLEELLRAAPVRRAS